MIANPDVTLAAIYHDPAGGYYSRPILTIDDDDICYVADTDGSLTPADEYDHLAYIDNTENI